MLKIGIVGAGRMGLAHAGNIVNLKEADLSAVYDIDPAKSKAFSEKYPQVKIVDSLEALVSDSNVDLIAITSPTCCHSEGIIAAMKTGKPIFCEKPLCRTRKELDELAPLLRSYKNLFAVGFVRRYSASFMMFEKLIKEGRIGEIIGGSVTSLFGGFSREWGDWFTDYQKSGGVTLDMLAHHCDLLNGLLGKPQKVYAQSFLMDRSAEKPRDYVASTVTFKNNVICTMESSWLRFGPNGINMIIYGEKGALKMEESGLTFYDKGGAETKIEVDEGILGPLQDSISGGMYATEMAKIVDCAIHGGEPYAGREEAINAMEFGLAMMESAEKGIVSIL